MNHCDFHVFWGVKKSESGLHRPVETFLDVVWPHDKLWKCSPDNFLSNAPTLVAIRQLLRDPTYFVKKVHLTPQKKRLPLNHLHIIIETASNLNKTKIHFLLFCWIRDILNFKSAQLKVNSLTYYKERFLHWKSFQKEFFRRMGGGGPCRVRASADALAPILRKNSFWYDFQCKKRSF